MSFYFYTETAFHHEGDMDFMKQLIDASAQVGADGIKFHVLIDIDAVISSKNHLYPKLKSCTFSLDEWVDIFNYAQKKNLDVVMLPVDSAAFKLVEKTKVSYFDLHSVSFYDDGVLNLMKSFGLPVILSAGGRTLNEINDKCEFFGHQLAVIMMGFQNFPTQFEELKIRKIQSLKQLYSQKAIGYADHSHYGDEMAIKANEYAYLLGATYFEKHITVAEGEERLDFQAALGAEKVKLTIENLKLIDKAIFSPQDHELHSLNESEIRYRNRQRVAVAVRNMEKGEVLSPELVTFKMLEQKDKKGFTDIMALQGRKLIKPILRDEMILETNLAL
ncbi:MAG: N-acetylneuraminate synthase [Saprospiraceae bacterium]|nr:MAG: N-acetylneuraminate synthase [Saprospiraceae bacterium]